MKLNIKLVEVCPACELLIKEKLSRGHFFSYKSACVVYSNGQTPTTEQDCSFLQEIYDLEQLKYFTTIENEKNEILTKPLGRFEINESVDGYCIDSGHKFMK